jgi:iron complex outermembrane receptor protein
VDIGTGGLTFVTSTTLTRRTVEAYNTLDLVVNYTVPAARAQSLLGYLKGMRFSVGVNNLADEPPPLAPQAWNDNNADISTYSPIGRLWYVSASVKF